MVKAPDDGHVTSMVPADLSSQMPATWLDQLSKVIKDTFHEERRGIIWATIAGSSVLAAFLGLVGDFLLVPYKARYEANVAFNSKLADLTLQNQNRTLEKRREAYENLDKELEKILRTLRTYVSTCEQVKNNAGAKGYVDFARSSWDSLTNELGDVTTAKNVCSNINQDDKDTPKAVDAVLGKLGPNLFSASVQKNKEINAELIQLMPELEDGITKVREQINGRKAGLTLTPTPTN